MVHQHEFGQDDEHIQAEHIHNVLPMRVILWADSGTAGRLAVQLMGNHSCWRMARLTT